MLLPFGQERAVLLPAALMRLGRAQPPPLTPAGEQVPQVTCGLVHQNILLSLSSEESVAEG